MKISDRILMAMVRMWNRKWLVTITIILGIFTIGLMGTTIHIYNEVTYREKEIARITKVDDERLLYVKIFNMNSEDKTLNTRIINFVRNINSIESLTWASSFIIQDSTITEKIDGLEKIYKEYNESGVIKGFENIFSNELLDEYNKSINTISINASALEATGIEIPVELSDLKITEEYIPVLVGYELGKIMPVGNSYILYSGKKIKVVGVLEEKSEYYCSSISSGNKPIICLDGYVVFPELYNYEENNTGNYRDSILAYMKNDNAYEEINKLANECGLVIDIYTIEELLDKQLEENEENQDVLMLMVVILLLTFIAYTAAGVVSVLTEKREIGIYYSCGFNRKNIASIILIENAIKIIISLIIGIYFVYREVVAKSLTEYYEILSKDVFLSYDLPFIIGIVLLMLCIVTIIPTILLGKIPISSMVRENS